MTIHGYVGTFTFPLGIWTDNFHTEHHQKLTDWGELAVQHNNYRVGTHGEMIYPAAGSYEDWAYIELGVWSFLLEMDWEYNLTNDSKMLMSFFYHSPLKRAQTHRHNGNCTRNFTAKNLPLSRP